MIISDIGASCQGRPFLFVLAGDAFFLPGSRGVAYPYCVAFSFMLLQACFKLPGPKFSDFSNVRLKKKDEERRHRKSR